MNSLMEILADILSSFNTLLTGKAVVDEIKSDYEPSDLTATDKS